MGISRIVIGMLLLDIMAFTASVASGQTYPSKPVRLVTSPAGGGGDLLARLIAQGISGPLGQPVVIDNRPPNIIGELVAQAPPDGHVMLLLGNILWMEPLVRKTPYDPVRDFAPISIVGMTPNVLVVHPSLPVKSVKELIALAKAKPGALNYASTGAGSNAELAGELFKSMAGVNIVGIPYKGAAPATISLVAGEVQVMITSPSIAIPNVESSRLRALAVTSAVQSALVPGLPALAETLPGFESVAIYVMVAPAKTPEAIIKRLNQEVVRALNRAEMSQKFLSVGVEVIASSPEALATYLKADMARWGKVIKDASIRSE